MSVGKVYNEVFVHGEHNFNDENGHILHCWTKYASTATKE
jgi:hypothetical protein